MTPCHVVEIVTPKRYVLNGLWFGPKKPKQVIVFVHGLSASTFSLMHVIERLVTSKTAVITFNNRGHDVISTVRRGRNKEAEVAGGAHERFTDCADDIQGAINFAKREGVKTIFLAGHSTGCQKSIYWAHRKNSKGVKGIILLAPISDWASDVKHFGMRKVTQAVKVARSLVVRGHKDSLLPEGIWPQIYDAQRFLNLHALDSVEEIFSYGQPKKNPRILESVHIPILVLWAKNDEYASHPIKHVSDWLLSHLRNGQVVVVPRAGHGFRGAEREVARTIRRWISLNKVRSA